MSTSTTSKIGYSFRHSSVRLGVATSVIVATVLAAAALDWWPVHRSVGELSARLSAERHALVEAQQAGELARLYARNLRGVPQLERKLEAAVDQTEIVAALTRLGREHGIALLSQTYAERAKANGDGLAIELAVQGSYESVRNFLHGLSALPVWIEVHEVQLDRMGDSGEVKGQLRMLSFRRVAGATARGAR